MEQVITYTTETESFSFADVARLYESVGFGSSSYYFKDKEFEAAFFCPAAYRFFALTESKQLIGMTRIFSDNKICSWIAELCIHPSWQNHGIGNKLLELIIDRLGHTAIYVDAFAGTEGFYIKRGIKPKSKLVACNRAGKINNEVSQSNSSSNKIMIEKC